MNIAYYISGHGFGHISRSFEIIKSILKLKPNTKIFACTLREEFVNEKIPNLFFRKVKIDIGMIQNSSISLDIESTLSELEKFQTQKEKIFKEEIQFLKKEKIELLISDSGSFPFLFSSELNLKSIFIGNFTWDFIYENYLESFPKFSPIINEIKEEYSSCNLGLILPFSTPIESIKKTKKIGLIGRKLFLNKEESRKK